MLVPTDPRTLPGLALALGAALARLLRWSDRSRHHPWRRWRGGDGGRQQQRRRRCLTGGPIYSTGAIGADGTLYIGSDDGNLYAIGP
jgi:outer membrane protein assembly factor BamB